MIEEREGHLLYLGNCHAYGWSPTERGLEEFLRQRDTGWRNRKTGQMIWPGDREENHTMENIIALLKSMQGITLVKTEVYSSLVENGLLQKLRADNLQQRNLTLIDEVDCLRKELDEVKTNLGETISKLKMSDNGVSYWFNRCEEVKKELDSVLSAMGIGDQQAESEDRPEDPSDQA